MTCERLNHRKTFSGPDTLVSEIAMIGWSKFKHASPGQLYQHIHPDCYEICLITRGTVDWWAGQEVWEVGPGHLYVTSPGEAHGGVATVMNPCTLYWLQYRPLQTPIIYEHPDRPRKDFRTDLRNLHPRCFPMHSGMAVLFARLLEEHINPTAYSAAMAISLVEQILILTIRAHKLSLRPSASLQQHSPRIARALQLIKEDANCRLNVDSLAAELAISAARLRFHFHREVGISPKEYLIKQRIRKARYLLQQGWSVTRTAMQCGFASSQHMATIFHKRYGLSPRQLISLQKSSITPAKS